MRLVTVAGPPSCGKTSILTRACTELIRRGVSCAAVKFDCLQTKDDGIYTDAGIPSTAALSGGLCPDHFFATNLEEAFAWAESTGAECCIVETAGLCNRCSPHLRGALALCVIDNLMGIEAPQKIGPMLRLADLVLVTKGDLVSLADRDTPSNRSVLLDNAKPDPESRFALQGRLVAQPTQNMNFVLDMGVRDFIHTHAASRGAEDPEATAENVILAANDLAGEPFQAETQLTQLSGGQSRALMIADAALLSWSPVLLIDEIENAGVDKPRALDLLVKSDKIVVIATHDPVLALSAGRRLVFENGAVHDMMIRSAAEERLLARLEEMEAEYARIRACLRQGQPLE